MSDEQSKQPKVVIDQNKCIGCQSCCQFDPDCFEFDENEYKAVVKKDPKISEKTKEAVDNCPVSAITIN
jgi:ferredoxin